MSRVRTAMTLVAGLGLVSGGLLVGVWGAIGVGVSDGQGLVSAKIMLAAAVIAVLVGAGLILRAAFRLTNI